MTHNFPYASKPGRTAAPASAAVVTWSPMASTWPAWATRSWGRTPNWPVMAGAG
jgi:hypothetical protein